MLGPLRNLAIGLGCRLPWLEREMIRTMSGIKLGFVAKPLTIPGQSTPRALPT